MIRSYLIPHVCCSRDMKRFFIYTRHQRHRRQEVSLKLLSFFLLCCRWHNSWEVEICLDMEYFWCFQEGNENGFLREDRKYEIFGDEAVANSLETIDFETYSETFSRSLAGFEHFCAYKVKVLTNGMWLSVVAWIALRLCLVLDLCLV